MPTIFKPVSVAAGVDEVIENASNMFNLKFDSKITKFVNWTVCTLQAIYLEQQKSNFQAMLMMGNKQIVFPNDWIHLEAQKMICNKTLCLGTLTIFNVSKYSNV